MITPPFKRILRSAASFAAILVLANLASAASANDSDAQKQAFDIPSGDARPMLKEFAAQAGHEIVFPVVSVEGIKTQAVKGEMTPREAIDIMLAGTGLVAALDEKTGAFAVRRENDSVNASPDSGSKLPTAAEVSSPPNASESRAAPDEVTKLSPFEVEESKDQGYNALNSNSITGFNAALGKLPLSADILDSTLMEDSGLTDMEQMIQMYSAGTGIDTGGPNGGNLQPGDRIDSGLFTLRGLDAPGLTLNGFMPLANQQGPGTSGLGMNSSFDTERIEIINGPQALLYGTGGAGGVINLVSKQARLDAPEFGSAKFQVDQYGGKLGEFDFGVGTDSVAVRIAIINQTLASRRVNVGGPLEGYYGQVAFKVFGHTVIRISGEQTTSNLLYGYSSTLVTASTANDARNNDYLVYLLATNQISSATGGGTSGAGVIANGLINWNNVQSYSGSAYSATTNDEWGTLTAETEWAPWLSTQFSVGYKYFEYQGLLSNPALFAPNAPTNPLGVWAMGTAATVSEYYEPARTKAIRFSALATNDLFGGRAHSQTILGIDFNRDDSTIVNYRYFQADSNFNVLYNSSTSNYEGRTLLPSVFWPVTKGLVQYPAPFYHSGLKEFSYQGVNYVRGISNPVNPALISPSDPLGTTAAGVGDNEPGEVINKGIFGTNYTQWLNGKLDTLLGFRLANAYEVTQTQALVGATQVVDNNLLSFDVGADYHITKWLTPYFTISDSYDPPIYQVRDPYGNESKTAHGIGEEVGLKLQNDDGTLSATLALYSVKSTNEQLHITAALVTDINPSGLNGIYGGAPTVWINVDRQSDGANLTLTSSPNANWRMRLSASLTNGTVETSTIYPQLYNDQFYTNSAGQVTYADGNVVYVNPTYNSKQPVVSSTTAGAVPLTVAAMSTPGNVYYASPLPISGQISSTTAVYTVLKATDPANAGSPILTGKVGLPISAYQLNAAQSGVIIPGAIPTSVAGEPTVGYPEFSANFTGVYTFTNSWMNGFELGGSVIWNMKNRNFFFYPQGLGNAISSVRSLYYFPNDAMLNLIVGYKRKFKRVTWTSQLNVFNLLNHYDVIIIPNPVTGWSGVDQATYNVQPRAYQWQNTISF